LRRGTLRAAAAVVGVVMTGIVSVSGASAAGIPDGQALVVLSHDKVARTTPSSTARQLTTLLPGDRYQIVNHWQPVTLPAPGKLLRQQQLLLSSNLKREIITTDAYIDQLVLNVYTGPGDTRVWIDDLEAGPVIDASPGGRPGIRSDVHPPR